MRVNLSLVMNPLLSGPLPNVYLTFDDGPYPETAEVLDALRTAQARATFFLCAKHLENNRALQFQLIKRMLAEGHSLGNHGYDHDPMTKKGYQRSTTDAVKKDFTDNIDKLNSLFKDHNESFPGFKVARLPGDGRFLKPFVKMITDEIHVPHAGWDFEFSRNGVMPHVKFANCQGIHGVAGTAAGLPKANNVLLLHDLHWKGKGDLLVKLIVKLKQHFLVMPLSPVPQAACMSFPF